MVNNGMQIRCNTSPKWVISGKRSGIRRGGFVRQRSSGQSRHLFCISIFYVRLNVQNRALFCTFISGVPKPVFLKGPKTQKTLLGGSRSPPSSPLPAPKYRRLQKSVFAARSRHRKREAPRLKPVILQFRGVSRGANPVPRARCAEQRGILHFLLHIKF